MMGLFLAVVGYCGFYFASTASHRDLLQTRAPELAWLKMEFNLSDAEFKRISELHESYMPHCKEMCRRIDLKNAELKALLASTNTLTEDIEKALTGAAQLRVDCQKMMLKHFYEVSQTMPPEQGKRYLAWVQEKTFLPTYGMRRDE
jgi:hypothetical protein